MSIIDIKWLAALPAVVLTAGAALAQDFTAGKTPAQLFSSDCSTCHHLPNGLGKKYDAGSLSAFLRAHYTTKPDNAGALAKYVMGFATLRAAPVTAPSADEGGAEIGRGVAAGAAPRQQPLRRRRKALAAAGCNPIGLKSTIKSRRGRRPGSTQPAPARWKRQSSRPRRRETRSRCAVAAPRANRARRSPSSMIMHGRALRSRRARPTIPSPASAPMRRREPAPWRRLPKPRSRPRAASTAAATMARSRYLPCRPLRLSRQRLSLQLPPRRRIRMRCRRRRR